VILPYRTAKSLFPAFSVPRGAVWTWRRTLYTAPCGTVPHRAVRTADGGTVYRWLMPSYVSNLVMGTAGLVGLDNVSSRLPFLGNLVLSGLLGLGGVS
jgi:hypothetical protein